MLQEIEAFFFENISFLMKSQANNNWYICKNNLLTMGLIIAFGPFIIGLLLLLVNA